MKSSSVAKPDIAGPPVVFYANGPARLLMSCLIAEQYYADAAERRLVLLDQYGYRYEALMPVAGEIFDRVDRLVLRSRRYSHLGQALSVYLGRFPALRRAVTPGCRAVLFGIRSPAQRFLLRRVRAMGGRAEVWAEGLSVDRLFQPRRDEPWRAILRCLFARAFEYLHHYEVLYVLARDMYRDHPAHSKLRDMPPLFTTEAARRLVDRLAGELDVDRLRGYEEVFFGQPLSDREGLLTREDEAAKLRQILGDRRILILPHPGEDAAGDEPDRVATGKYDGLPGAEVYRGSLPNDLLVTVLRPRRTSTWASTIGIHYAAAFPESHNVFFPVDTDRRDAIRRYQPYLANIEIDERFLAPEDP